MPESSGAELLSRRSRRIFFAFLAVSVAVHAAVLGMLTASTRGPDPVPASVLQVSLLEPLPLPAGPPEPQSRARAPSDGKREANTEPGLRWTLPVPVGTLPEPVADERRSFAVGAEIPDPAATTATESAASAPAAAAPASVSAAYLQNPLPRYPAESRRAGEQGTVMLRVLVSREGAAVRVELERSSGSPHLDAAARETVKAWRFTPARRGAEAIESWLVVPVVFRLEGPS
jgi:periplasmic protein TonB